jgi:hypothetical protein
MALQFDTTDRNDWLNQLTTTLGASGSLVIYSGSAPANVAASATGTLLATEALSNPAFPAASAGAMVMSGLPLTVNASNNGTAGYFRLLDSGSVARWQGTCGQGTGDLSFDNATFVSGQPVNITGFTVTAPGA